MELSWFALHPEWVGVKSGERHFDAGSGRRPPHHLRTANPILSTFATVRHQHHPRKGLPLEHDGAGDGA